MKSRIELIYVCTHFTPQRNLIHKHIFFLFIRAFHILFKFTISFGLLLPVHIPYQFPLLLTLFCYVFKKLYCEYYSDICKSSIMFNNLLLLDKKVCLYVGADDAYGISNLYVNTNCSEMTVE